MKKHLLFLLILFSFNATAQSDFLPGYIITNDLDTINGLIDNRGEILNTSKCRFMENKESAVTEFGPDEISAFRFINDRFYIARKVPMAADTSLRFVEFLVNGVVDLFLYRDSFGVRYFISSAGDRLVELKEEDIRIYQDNKVYMRKNNEYKGVLYSLFQKAPQLNNDIQKVRLNRTSLIKITESYHNEVCTDQKCQIYTKNLKKLRVTTSITGGGIWESMLEEAGEINSKNRYEFNQLTPITKPIIGLAFQFFSPNNQRLFVQFEPTLYTSSYNSTYDYFFYFGRTKTANFSVDYTNLGTDFYLRYALLKKKIQPTVYAGLSIDATVNYNSENLPDYQSKLGKLLACGYSAGLGVSYKLRENKEVSLRLLYHHLYGSLTYMNSNSVSLTLAVPMFTL